MGNPIQALNYSIVDYKLLRFKPLYYICTSYYSISTVFPFADQAFPVPLPHLQKDEIFSIFSYPPDSLILLILKKARAKKAGIPCDLSETRFREEQLFIGMT